MIVEVISLAVTLAAVIFFVVVSRRPADFRISRSLAIGAPAPVIFAQVNDLHKWQAWSPWEGIDADLKRTYEGPTAGVGAKYGWEGKKTGVGAMTIAQSQEPASVRLDLDFLKPFKASNVVEFTFQPQGRETLVSWAMTGKDTFVTKVFCMLCDRDKMCGDMFVQGLTKLKGVCESA